MSDSVPLLEQIDLGLCGHAEQRRQISCMEKPCLCRHLFISRSELRMCSAASEVERISWRRQLAAMQVSKFENERLNRELLYALRERDATLATVFTSRTWKVGQFLRKIFGRR